MAYADDKEWAAKYILDPLTAPEPSDETGLGTHHISSVTRIDTPPGSASFKQRASQLSARHDTSKGKKRFDYPTPPTSASPRRKDQFWPSSPTNRPSSASDSNNPFRHHMTRSVDNSFRDYHSTPSSARPGLRRGNSLQARYPGDQSNQPLEIIRRHTKRANKAPHLRQKHIPRPDTIDVLDNSSAFAYHHEGPYDATLLARNTSFDISPVAAVKASNEAALKATPKHKIKEAIERRRPLDGVAVLPSGSTDYSGQRLEYEEGANLQVEDGYKRWPGMKYLDEDIKGKGEPSYTIEKNLKELKSSRRRRGLSEPPMAIELTDNPVPRKDLPLRSRNNISSHPTVETESRVSRDWESNGLNRSRSISGTIGEGLKKRFGSLRRKKKTDE